MTVDVLNKYVFVDASPGFIPKTIARNLSSVKYGIKLMSTGLGNLFRFVFGKLSLFDGTERLVRLFYRSILLDEPVPVSPEEGLHSMRLMDEIWQQLQSSNDTNGATRHPGE